MNMEQYLKSLGDAPAEVIRSLEKLRLTGRRHHCSDCIIARALSQKFGGEFHVYNDEAARIEGNRSVETCELPEPVEEVRTRFDEGQLPQFDYTLVPEYQI